MAAAVDSTYGQEYDTLGTTFKQQAQQAAEAANRRLQQSFAGGRLRSGALAKLQTQQEAQIGQGLQGQLANLSFQKAQQQAQERLIGQQQGFQTSERVGTQDFAAGEAQKQREFATGERQGTQNFQAQQSSLDRELQKSNINLGYSQLNELNRQFNSEFAENVKTNLFNKLVALKDIDSGRLNDILNSLNIGSVPDIFSQLNDPADTTSAYKSGFQGQGSGGGVLVAGNSDNPAGSYVPKWLQLGGSTGKVNQLPTAGKENNKNNNNGGAPGPWNGPNTLGGKLQATGLGGGEQSFVENVRVAALNNKNGNAIQNFNNILNSNASDQDKRNFLVRWAIDANKVNPGTPQERQLVQIPDSIRGYA
jgi:hypothetical protein